MKKVITYGTFDLLHYGHIRLLERAKEMGDYLIVGVTADSFDKIRGKINVQQTLMERIESVKSTGLADQIIVEEYEGQKIDDIKRYDVDKFIIGNDWKGKFDYLKDYCEVVYLERTQGISSTELRTKGIDIKMGIVGDYPPLLNKFKREDKYVNGVEIIGICTNNINQMSEEIRNLPIRTDNYEELLENVDAVYINSNINKHYKQIKQAIISKKHVLCESPISTKVSETKELFELAKENNVILLEAIKTAYSTAYARLQLLLTSGKIGRVLSVDVTCSSIRETDNLQINSLFDWGSTALLPVFQILGTNYKRKTIVSYILDSNGSNDGFTKIDFIYPNATATIKVAEKAKSEGELIVTGTKGYVYVPAPWWKTDYFEIRYENPVENKRYFYQLDGEGIRYELLSFARSIKENKSIQYIEQNVSLAISKIIEDFKEKKDLIEI